MKRAEAATAESRAAFQLSLWNPSQHILVYLMPNTHSCLVEVVTQVARSLGAGDASAAAQWASDHRARVGWGGHLWNTLYLLEQSEVISFITSSVS